MIILGRRLRNSPKVAVSFLKRTFIPKSTDAKVSDREEQLGYAESRQKYLQLAPPTPEPNKHFLGKAELSDAGRHMISTDFLDNFDQKFRASDNIDIADFIKYARTCVTEGTVDRIVEKHDLLPHKVWSSKSFLLNYFIAQLMSADFSRARLIALKALRGGASGRKFLLRMIGEAYLLSDPNILRAAATQLFTNFSNELRQVDVIFAYNTLANYLGPEELLSFMRPATLLNDDSNTLLFQSNLALLDRNYEDQLNLFNRTLDAFGLEPIRAPNSANPLSIRNIASDVKPACVQGPIVTVVMSTFNSEATVESALRSLLNQTYADLEIMVVDDCSTDRTCDIVARMAERAPSIKLHRMKENGGTYKIRNFGLLNGIGEYFTCLDSDDWAHPRRIEKAVRSLQSDLNAIAAKSQLVRLSETQGLKAKPEGYIHDDMSSLTFRRKLAMESIGFYHHRMTGADSEYLARIVAKFGAESVKTVEAPLLVADWSGRSLSGSVLTGITDGGTMCVSRVRYRTEFRRQHKRVSRHVPEDLHELKAEKLSAE